MSIVWHQIVSTATLRSGVRQ